VTTSSSGRVGMSRQLYTSRAAAHQYRSLCGSRYVVCAKVARR
jgi:hypothetical protein